MARRRRRRGADDAGSRGRSSSGGSKRRQQQKAAEDVGEALGSIRFRIGVRVVEDNTDEIVKRIRKNAAAIVAKTALDIEAAAKKNVAAHGLIDTGNLVNSIKAREVGEMLWRVSVGADYGIYHEMGTRFLPPRPFLSPAAERARPVFMKAMSDLTKRQW